MAKLIIKKNESNRTKKTYICAVFVDQYGNQTALTFDRVAIIKMLDCKISDLDKMEFGEYVVIEQKK